MASLNATGVPQILLARDQTTNEAWTMTYEFTSGGAPDPRVPPHRAFSDHRGPGPCRLHPERAASRRLLVRSIDRIIALMPVTLAD